MGRKFLLMASCASAIFATDAVAQTTEAEAQSPQSALGEIIVTAQKRSENLQKVPIAITAVSAEGLTKAGVESTQALAAAIPGLQLLNVGNQLSPRIRGVGSSAIAAGLESPVAIYVDGVYYASSADVILDFADVEQVALLKGPQGTLFGRNATGGVVQITTRGPRSDFEGSFQTSLDNYLTSRSNLFVTGGLSEGLEASLSLTYVHQGKGWGKNVATGSDIHKIDHSFTAHGRLRAYIGDRTTVDLSADYTSREGPQAALFRTYPGYSSIFPSPQPKDKWSVNQFADGNNIYHGGGGSLKIEHEMDFATLTSITAYRDAYSMFQFVNVPSATPTNLFNVPDKNKEFTQELQLVSPSSGPLTWAIGAYYFHSDAKSVTNVREFGGMPTVQSLTMIAAHQKANSVAGFAQATYSIMPSTRFTAGIRYTYEKRRLFDNSITITPTGGTPTVIPVPDDTFVSKEPTWRLSLDHDFTPDILGYVSYNRGTKSGGWSNRAPTNPAFDSEKIDAYEAGIKAQLFDRTVRFNLGGFYYDYSNIQVPIYTGSSTLVINGAAAENYGIDAELVMQVSDALRINASANWLHARFTDFPGAPIAVENPGRQGAATTSGDASGNRLPNSPDFSFLIGFDYTIPTSNGDITISASDSYNGGFYPEVDNILRQDSFHLVNASIQWQSSDRQFTIRAFVNNLLDEAVVSQVVSAPFGYIADFSNPPRTIGGSIKIGF